MYDRTCSNGVEITSSYIAVRPHHQKRCDYAYSPVQIDDSASYPNITIESIDWEDSLQPPDSDNEFQSQLASIDADVILGADIVFDPQLIPALVTTLSAALRQSSSRSVKREAFVALTLRNSGTVALFLRTAGQLYPKN